MKPVIAHDGIQRKEYAAVKYDTTMALDSHDITDSMTAEQAELICLSRCFFINNRIHSVFMYMLAIQQSQWRFSL